VTKSSAAARNQLTPIQNSLTRRIDSKQHPISPPSYALIDMIMFSLINPADIKRKESNFPSNKQLSKIKMIR
jgi:hypothetical protein